MVTYVPAVSRVFQKRRGGVPEAKGCVTMKMTTSSADGERQEAMRTAVRGRLLRERSVQALRWRGATVAIVAASLAGVAAPMVAAAAPAPAPALTTGVRELDYGTHFNATGIEDSRLRFAYTRFSEVDGKGVIHLGITKWAEGPTGWDPISVTSLPASTS